MIINSNTYKGYELNPSVKNKNGFYERILDELLKQINYCIQYMSRPIAVHLTIDQPKKKIRLDKFITKFKSKRKGILGSKIKDIHYISIREVRPRNKNEHLHIMLIIDSGTYKDCIALEELAQTLSLTKTARVCKRRYSDRPLKINKETGEIEPTKYGDDFKREGAAFYHDVKTETEDTIKRFSYLAKVFSKTNSSFSSTRLPRQKKTKSTETVETESPKNDL